LPSKRRVTAPFADPRAGHASLEKRDRKWVIRLSDRAVNSYFYEPLPESMPVENSVEIIEQGSETLLRDCTERERCAALVCNRKKLEVLRTHHAKEKE
jgi:hypothetical protein